MPRRRKTAPLDSKPAPRNFLVTPCSSINRRGQNSEGYRMNVLNEFIKLKPPAFEGKPDPLAAERWLEAVKVMLDTMGVVVEYRVEFATYLFEGSAEEWWDLKGDAYGVADLNWEEFETLFRETYAPETLQLDKIAQLNNLVQKDMTVSQYHACFIELSSYDPLLVAEPGLRCVKFRRGLKSMIKSKLEPFTYTEFNELVNAAQEVETYLMRKQKDKDDRQKDSVTSCGSSGFGCTKTVVCYRCNRLGHRQFNCPLNGPLFSGGQLRVRTKSPLSGQLRVVNKKSLKRSTVQRKFISQASHGKPNRQLKQSRIALAASEQSNSSLVGRNLSSQSGSSVCVCYACGEVGHRKRACPHQHAGSVLSVGGQLRHQSSLVSAGAQMVHTQPSALPTPPESLGFLRGYCSQNQPQTSVFQPSQYVAPPTGRQGFNPRIGGPTFN